jgi:hypothetical protein
MRGKMPSEITDTGTTGESARIPDGKRINSFVLQVRLESPMFGLGISLNRIILALILDPVNCHPFEIIYNF